MSGMLSVDRDAVRSALTWRELRRALGVVLAASGDEVASPDRIVIPISEDPDSEQTLLLMPSWAHGSLTGVKIVTHVPGNDGRGLPSIHAVFVATDGTTGEVRAVIDGDELTVRRTAAISALAGASLIRRDAQRLLIVGTGQLAPVLAEAHLADVDFASVTVWGRDRRRAEATARSIRTSTGALTPVGVGDDLRACVADADVVVTATGASDPLVRGADVRPGTHVSLVGSYQPSMCEGDVDLMQMASVFVDTRAGALLAGELARPVEAGVFDGSIVVGDLADLVTGRHPGRCDDDEITVFKSAGFALADLAAARVVLDALDGPAG